MKMATANSILVFDEEMKGYCKAQVNSYVGNLMKAYQEAYEEYHGLQEKFNFLMNEYKKLELLSRVQLNATVISKKMLNVETLARQIIEEKQWIDKVLN
jgi:cell division septum initiation protein DivIVA